MGALKKSAATAGYDQEDAYFHKQDRELIEKMRKRSHLTLIPGGKAGSPEGTPAATEPKQKKTG